MRSPYFPTRSRGALEITPFLSQDGTFDRAYLKTDSTVDAGVEIDPVKLGAFFITAFSGLNARNRTRIKAIRDPLADISHDCVSHQDIEAGAILVSQPMNAAAATFGTQGLGL